ncbi:MAG: VWA domain-containing protein [Chloroflexi bacterium]|nr:VWA domain-containing protein [Chloroflexota bacterium]MCI0867279.1 VWA domain-containing protein [Chloroflexota bacterium]
MTGNYESELNEQLIQRALAEELDSVAPRSDLWPAVQAGVQLPAPKSQRHWVVRPLGTAAVLGALALVALLVSVPMVTKFSGSGYSSASQTLEDTRRYQRGPVLSPTATAAGPQASSVETLRSFSSGSRIAGQQGSPGEALPYSTGGSATVNDAPYDATFFKHYGVNPFIDTEEDHLSTFAMDVDTASYTVARRFVRDGHLPDPDSVRVEEFINYFAQEYEPPVEGAFAINIEAAPSPFGGERHWLMRVGLQGKVITAAERKDASLVFVIDVSGSMARQNRLELVKKALGLLVEELRPTDDVGLVVYGSRGRVVLEPTSGENKEAILAAISKLQPEGSTNAEEGLRLGYKMASQLVEPGRITRLILLSDGVANVGRTGSDSILKEVRRYADDDIPLSTIGFGMGNYNDVLMEQLANDGDGNYAYVDTLSQARRVFVENLTGMLQVIAKDAKVQVDFDSNVVSRYRLLGYENRRIADRDFRNDTVDAGEVGAGHTVTALYEIKFHEGVQGRIATVSLRYQDPDTGEVQEISREFHRSELTTVFEQASPRFQLNAAVAEYAEILRESYWAQDSSLEQVKVLAQRVKGLLAGDPDVAEFAGLVDRAERIGPE